MAKAIHAIFRYVIIGCAAAIIIIPWVWYDCYMSSQTLFAIGLSVISLGVAVGLLVINTGHDINAKAIDGILGIMCIIAGLLNIQLSDSVCNLLAVMILMLCNGVIFIVDMVFLILGK